MDGSTTAAPNNTGAVSAGRGASSAAVLDEAKPGILGTGGAVSKSQAEIDYTNDSANMAKATAKAVAVKQAAARSGKTLDVNETAQGAAADAAATSPVRSSSSSASNAASSGQGMKRTLTTMDLIIFGMIFMVPIAPFSILASVYDTSNGMPALAYLIGMVAMLFTALSFGLMVPRYPSSGSIYVYASHEINGPVGFVVGWLMILQYLITPAVMLIMAGEALHTYIPGIPVWVWCLVFLAFITVISMRGMGATVLVDKLALAAEMIVLLLFFVFGVIYIVKHPETAHFNGDAFFNASKFNFGSVMSAVSLCALSFVGFGSIVTLDGECIQPRKAPPKAMIWIVLVLGVLYMAMSFIAASMDPSGSIMKADPTNGFYTVASLAGQWLGVLCAVANALALGLFTSLSGMTAISRLMYVMGRDNAFPKQFQKVDKKTGVPTFATCLVAIVTLVLVFVLLYTIGMDQSAKISNYGALASYFMLNISVLWGLGIKGKIVDHGKWVRTILFPVIGAIVTFVIFISLGTEVWIIGTTWLVLGIVYYLWWTKVRKNKIDLLSATN